MADNIIDQLWYSGQELRKPGTIFLGFIVDAQDKTGARRFQVRIPALHGYCDLDDQNCESQNVTKKAALPWAETLASDSAVGLLTNNDTPSFHKGDFVLVRFKSHTNLTNPVIISRTTPPNPLLGGKEKFSQSGPLITASLVDILGENKSVTQANNGCFEVVVAADQRSSNGTNVQGADKCGEVGRIKDGFAANIADFMKIIQDTDGKVGSYYVSKYTGELFQISGYISSYVSNLAGIFRSGIGWIKAIITKYARKAIDALLKAILQPVKGITKVVSETLEKILNMIACSFGDLEKFIENLLTDLLNSLLDGALNAVFSCLDSLVDGILNEILSQALELIETIMSSISAIAGLIGDFGDLIGQAINSILDFLGISCGGAGDCTVSGQKSFIAKFNEPGEYGFPSGLKRTLINGASSLTQISTAIDNNSAQASAAAASAAAGIQLGTSAVPDVGSVNPYLVNVYSTAQTMIGDGIIGFCNNLYYQQGTTAVVVGQVDDTYDSTYIITTDGDVVNTGESHTFVITRNNDLSDGIVNFVAYLEQGDTARVVGITPGLSTSGDLSKDVNLSSADYASDPKNSSRFLPVEGNIFASKKIHFPKGVKKKKVTIKTNSNTPLSNTIDEVQYTAGVFRSSDDLNNTKYPGKNLPNSSPVLNTVKARIKFSIPAVTVSGTTPSLPPSINTINLTYRSQDVSVSAGSDAIFTITRTPVDTSYSRIKCQTINDTAQSGVHFEGGEALIEFKPQQASATFAVKTSVLSGVTNSLTQFKVRLIDETVPSGITTNLGGTGFASTTSIGSGITYNATINYNLSNTVVPLCIPEILITSPPPTCIVQPDTLPLSIGLIAKTTVAGYTLSYQWQRTYSVSSGWFNIVNGTYSGNVSVKETNFTQIGSVTVSGVTVPVSGWTTSIVSKPASTVYNGAFSNTLVIDPPSYLLNDEEYYRCVVTATPSVVTSGTPVLSTTTIPTYVGITSSGVFLTSVNCSPVAPSGGAVIVYSGTTPTVGGSTGTDVGLCVTPIFPIPAVSSGITQPQPTVSGITTTSGVPTILPVVPSGTRIIPVESDDDDIPVIPVIVDPGGGVSSIPVPDNLPRYKYPPLIPITGTGVGATARAELDDNGVLTKIIIKSKGLGYQTTAEQKLCGILESIEVTNVGGYYESSPTVYVDGDSSIAFAAIENGRVVQIRITNPQNKVYRTIPRIDIIGGDGIGASAIGVLKYVDCAKVSDEYLNIVDKYNTRTIGTTRVVDCP
jgi:hypothetical protein